MLGHCDLLTGHSMILSFQYRINLTYTPVCTCLIEEETACTCVRAMIQPELVLNPPRQLGISHFNYPDQMTAKARL